MSLEEIEILKAVVQREHKSDVIRVLEEMELVERRREAERLALRWTPAEQDMRERVDKRAAEMVRRVLGRALETIEADTAQ